MKTSTKILVGGVLGLAALTPMRDHAPNVVDVIVSNDGEALPAFLARVGQRMSQLSEFQGWEYCGEVATDGKAYGVDITTTGAHVACIIDPSAVPSGMHDSGETIHNHGNGKPFAMNATDLGIGQVPEWAKQRGKLIHGENLYQFSQRDFASGPGYLATPLGVIHQSGEDHITTIITYEVTP